MYFSVIFDLSGSFSTVGKGVVIVLVSVAAVGSLLIIIIIIIIADFIFVFMNHLLYNLVHLAALFTRSHLIGDHPSGLTKEQTRETMDPNPKTKPHCFSCLFFC